MKTEVRMLVTLWVVILTALLATVLLRSDINECTFMPNGIRSFCDGARTAKTRFGYPGPATGQLEFSNFPFTRKDGQLTLPIDAAIKSGGTVPIRYMNEPIGLSVKINEHELGWEKSELGWLYQALEFQCDTGIPRALILNVQNDLISSLKSIYYFTPTNEESDLFFPAKISWVGDINKYALAFETEIERLNNAAEARLATSDFVGRPVYRALMLKSVERPHSISGETGIPGAFTYALRKEMTNKFSEAEYYILERVIILPYQRGTIKISGTTTSIKQHEPDLLSWREVWRGLEFESANDFSLAPYVNANGLVEETVSPAVFFKSNLSCEWAGRLPPRWAWPKHAPKYQLPFWPHWTFG